MATVGRVPGPHDPSLAPTIESISPRRWARSAASTRITAGRFGRLAYGKNSASAASISVMRRLRSLKMDASSCRWAGRGRASWRLYALDGSTAWAAGDDPASYCPVYPITLRGRRVIVAYLQNAVVLHDAATGERLCRQHLSDDYDEHSAWPLFSEPYLFLAAPFKHGCS